MAGQDGPHWGHLAGAMPGVCRALGYPADEPLAAPRSILRSFVAALTDHLVREASGGQAFPPAAPRSRARGVTFDSMHDQWLAALRAPDGKMDGDPQALAVFATHVKEWTQALSLGHDPSVRLCFRLEEPAPNGANDDQVGVAAAGKWQVEYLLQATDDPSLLVPAQDVWRAGGQRGAVIQSKMAAPREKLLAALGRRAPRGPGIEASSPTRDPTGHGLHTPGAPEVLARKARLRRAVDCASRVSRRRAGSAICWRGWTVVRRSSRCLLPLACAAHCVPIRSAATPGCASCRNGDWARA